MKKIGLIMEVNPFHNGHIHFLNEVKKKYKEDYLIAIISTTIVQRGQLSMLNKTIKTELLLKNGVDIVIELPVIYSNQGGEYFGFNSVKILNDLNIDILVFGSETYDKNYLSKIVKKQTESIQNKNIDFKDGYLKDTLKDLKSNDILGISYIKGINKINNKIKYDLIKRESNINVHNQNFISATEIRKSILDLNTNKIKDFLPSKSLKNLKLIEEQKLIDLLKIKLIENSNNIYLSENGQLLKKILKNVNKEYTTLEQLAILCSDKNNSKYKFQRIFLNIILNVTAKEVQKLNSLSNKYKVLGFSKRYQKELKKYNNLFFSYKEININNSIYKYNEKIDLFLTAITGEDYNRLNYLKPIIY